jgi:hypothetical protein
VIEDVTCVVCKRKDACEPVCGKCTSWALSFMHNYQFKELLALERQETWRRGFAKSFAAAHA